MTITNYKFGTTVSRSTFISAVDYSEIIVEMTCPPLTQSYIQCFQE